MDPHIRRKVIRNRKRRIKALIREHLRTAGLGHVQGITLIGQWSTRSNALTTKLYEVRCQGCTGTGHANVEVSPERKITLGGVRGEISEKTCQQIQSRVVVQQLRGPQTNIFGGLHMTGTMTGQWRQNGYMRGQGYMPLAVYKMGRGW